MEGESEQSWSCITSCDETQTGIPARATSAVRCATPSPHPPSSAARSSLLLCVSAPLLTADVQQHCPFTARSHHPDVLVLQLGHQAANCTNGTINWKQIYGEEAFRLKAPLYESDFERLRKVKQVDFDDLAKRAREYAKVGACPVMSLMQSNATQEASVSVPERITARSIAWNTVLRGAQCRVTASLTPQRCVACTTCGHPWSDPRNER